MSDTEDAVDLGIPGVEGAMEIGRGGFAVVYRARQPELNRTIAIKVLSTRLDDDGRERFAREGWAMGTLSSHPNIVSVIDTGVSASGRPYIAMAYLREGSLADRIDRDGPLPWVEAARIAIKLAGALETAHGAGTLHRDVKPENVLLSDYGEPELTDFGIARVEGRYETGTGHVMASAAHAAPEVLEGRAATAVSDVYSLGSTLFALLAGQPAFVRGADEPMVAYYLRIVQDPVPDLRPRGTPAALCAVIEQAMAKDPSSRQASAAELGRQLQEIQRRSGLPVTEMALALPEGARPGGEAVRPTGVSGDAETGAAGDPGPRRGSRAPLRLTAGMGLAAAVLAGALVLVNRDEGGDQPAPAGRGTLVATSVAPATTVAAPSLPGVVVGDAPTSVAANPRNNRLYVANSGSLTVSVVDGFTKTVVATVPVPTRPQTIAVNQRSGRVYVTTAESSVVVINGDSNEVLGTVTLSARPIGLAVDHRTDRVFVATSEPLVAVIEGSTNRVVTTVPMAAKPGSVAIIPETNRVFVTSQDAGTLSVIDGATYEVVATLAVGARPCGVAANPRSRRAYVTDPESSSVAIVDADANTVLATVRVGLKVCGVAVNSQTSRVYLTDQEGGRILVLDGIANEALKATEVSRPTRAAEPLPYGVDVNPQTGGVYVVLRSDNRLLTLSGDQL